MSSLPDGLLTQCDCEQQDDLQPQPQGAPSQGPSPPGAWRSPSSLGLGSLPGGLGALRVESRPHPPTHRGAGEQIRRDSGRQVGCHHHPAGIQEVGQADPVEHKIGIKLILGTPAFTFALGPFARMVAEY